MVTVGEGRVREFLLSLNSYKRTQYMTTNKFSTTHVILLRTVTLVGYRSPLKACGDDVLSCAEAKEKNNFLLTNS